MLDVIAVIDQQARRITGGERLRRHPELVIGRSVLEAEAIYDDLRPPAGAQHDRGEPSSAGLDAAIWDAMGHTLGLPLAKLLGHQRTSAVTPYCTCMYRKDWPDLARGGGCASSAGNALALESGRSGSAHP